MSLIPSNQRLGGASLRLISSLEVAVCAIDGYDAVITARLADEKNWSGPHLEQLLELQKKLVKRRVQFCELALEIKSFSGKRP